MHEKVGKFIVVRPDFSLDLKNLVRMKSFFDPCIREAEGGKGIVLDLSEVGQIDSMGHKAIHNIQSALIKHKERLIVYADSKDIQEQIRSVHSGVTQAASRDEAFKIALQSSASDAFLDVNLECPLCGSRALPRKALNRENLGYFWDEEGFLPKARDLITGDEVDHYRAGIITCGDCLFTSFYHTDFINISGETRLVPPFSHEVKSLLTRCAGRRKELLRKVNLEPQDFPGDGGGARTLEYQYRLLMDCVTSAAFDKSINRFYEMGLATVLAHYFMPEESKDKALLEAACQHFSMCIRTPPEGKPDKTWEAYYFIIAASILLGKKAVSRQVIMEMDKEKEAIGAENADALRRFTFWHSNSHKWYNREVLDDANRFSA